VGESAEAVAQVSDAILRYLLLHPDAADSEDGIADWWMPAMALETNAAQVAAALHALHRRGLVAKVTLPDGRVIYRAGSGAN
jgi:hypothetical protein